MFYQVGITSVLVRYYTNPFLQAPLLLGNLAWYCVCYCITSPSNVLELLVNDTIILKRTMTSLFLVEAAKQFDD